MTAPQGKAWFGDAFAGLDDVADPAAERDDIIDRIARAADLFPDWIADSTGTAVELTVAEAVPGRTVIVWRAAGHQGRVTVTADPSGWLLAVAEYGGTEVLRAYVDHVYEEFDCYPPGWPEPDHRQDAPGRIGKKLSWISLSTTHWPVLEAVDGGTGWLNVQIDDSKVRLHKPVDSGTGTP